MRRLPLIFLIVLAVVAPAAEIVLQSPLSTVVRFAQNLPVGDKTIVATVVVPADAPTDLGVGAFVSDRHGSWFQCLHPGRLLPGRHELRFIMAEGVPLLSEPWVQAWTAAEAIVTTKAGLFFWSASPSRATLAIEGLKVVTASAEIEWEPVAAPATLLTAEENRPRRIRQRAVLDATAKPALAIATQAAVSAAKAPSPAAKPEDKPIAPAPPVRQPQGLYDLRLEGAAGMRAGAVAGERWSVEARPDPFPANPYDPAEFALDALITAPDGSERRIPGFFAQPMRAGDRGDSEELVPDGPGSFCVRFRPEQPGTYQVRLEARWRGVSPRQQQLPPLMVGGAPWNGFVRVDAVDPRFFAADGKFFWALGPNMRSVNDVRGNERLSTKLTTDRGTLSYHAYLERAAAAGVTAIEVWMSAWNLALEWRGDWPGYYGQGRYNQEHAWRLDRILDDAWRLGIRVNLVINNHGQASAHNDREWPSNPYHLDQGGKLTQAYEFFSDPWALAGQDNLRRYIVARYADHPAVLGWKLWSEVNLTGGGPALVKWHSDAANRWHELDTYHHGVATHWCGDYTNPDRTIAALPELDYLCIDAYHGSGRLLADLVYNSTLDPGHGRGLAQLGKPVLITEFGGNWDACPKPQLLAEHVTGPWAAMVSGNAGAPMLWWIEWLDQGDLWQPYAALSRFLVGEDLRGVNAKGVVFDAQSGAGRLWARAWSRQGRMLGYLLDEEWGTYGTAEPLHDQAKVPIGSEIAAGAMAIEWWDASTGRLVIPVQTITHPGGALVLSPPPFKRHLAFKLYRLTT